MKHIKGGDLMSTGYWIWMTVIHAVVILLLIWWIWSLYSAKNRLENNQQ